MTFTMSNRGWSPSLVTTAVAKYAGAADGGLVSGLSTRRDNRTGTLLGTPIGRLPFNEQSATIQLVQQSPYLQLSGCTFSVEEEVAFGPENLCLAEKEIMARIDAALALTECQPLRHRHPATLSGGETQRVVIACATAMQPKLLILDEAFSRLTPQAREMLLQRLQHWALERGSLIILFERHHTPFLNHCQQAWQLQNGALQPLC